MTCPSTPRVAFSNIPCRYDLDLDSPKLREIVPPSAIERFLTVARDLRDPIVLTGPSGSGKTLLACAWLRSYRPEGDAEGEATLWFTPATSQDLDDPTVVGNATRGTALVLDHLYHCRHESRNAVQRILHYRYDHELPTILTTTMQPYEIERTYGEHVHRRLYSRPERVIQLSQ